MNEREQAAHDHIASYVADRWVRYTLTPAGEALLAANADRLAGGRAVRECNTCGVALPRGRIRFCGLACWRKRTQ